MKLSNSFCSEQAFCFLFEKAKKKENFQILKNKNSRKISDSDTLPWLPKIVGEVRRRGGVLRHRRFQRHREKRIVSNDADLGNLSRPSAVRDVRDLR